jgi:signal transduction histidine kinase
MLRDKQKIVRVLDELLNYAMHEDPQEVTITIEEKDDRLEIAIEDIGIQLSEEECRQAERYLNTPRRNEMRGYYGGLLGEETLYPHNLRIVGMMVDGGRLEGCEGGTRLSVWWEPE